MQALRLGNPPRAAGVIDHRVFRRTRGDQLCAVMDRVGDADRGAARPFEPCGDLDFGIEGERAQVLGLGRRRREVESLLHVVRIGSMVLVHPRDPREFEITDVIRVMHDTHGIGFVEGDAMSEGRPGHGPTAGRADIRLGVKAEEAGRAAPAEFPKLRSRAGSGRGTHTTGRAGTLSAPTRFPFGSGRSGR